MAEPTLNDIYLMLGTIQGKLDSTVDRINDALKRIDALEEQNNRIESRFASYVGAASLIAGAIPLIVQYLIAKM